MTTLMSTHSLHMTAGHLPLFDSVDLSIRSGDRIGLIGANGSGKSTLLALLAGQLDPHDGRVHHAAACRCEFVAQHLPARLQALTARAVLLDAVDGDPALDWQVDKMLTELQLEAQGALPVSALSGGQHTRLQIGRALLRQPNLLLLDEPSNHMDLPALLWLERFLLGWRGAFVLVSHDGRLLDRVTRETLILRDRCLYRFALSLASHHLLWLDEPTNHLDLEGKEDLAEALSRFAGGVLLISHDRDLIERSCNRFWVIREGRIVEAHSAERAYAELLCDEPMDLSISPATDGSPQEQATVEDDEEALLARWYELDALLAADLARKPRHQTPRLQQQWRDELQQLAGLLGLPAN